jgi:hypothetical protein
MPHSPAFDIVGASGGGRTDPVPGVDRRRSPETYQVRRTQGRQGSFEGGEGNLAWKAVKANTRNCGYARTASNTAVRVTVITLMSSSCPKLCAALATSVADLAARTSS